ncbi:MAG: hypothetical protein H6707_14775 [Deltaproteobacteria bacterium]|nr:hypothetical protein [Deltaproteobacteria bacterium]
MHTTRAQQFAQLATADRGRRWGVLFLLLFCCGCGEPTPDDTPLQRGGKGAAPFAASFRLGGLEVGPDRFAALLGHDRAASDFRLVDGNRAVAITLADKTIRLSAQQAYVAISAIARYRRQLDDGVVADANEAIDLFDVDEDGSLGWYLREMGGPTKRDELTLLAATGKTAERQQIRWSVTRSQYQQAIWACHVGFADLRLRAERQRHPGHGVLEVEHPWEPYLYHPVMISFELRLGEAWRDLRLTPSERQQLTRWWLNRLDRYAQTRGVILATRPAIRDYSTGRRNVEQMLASLSILSQSKGLPEELASFLLELHKQSRELHPLFNGDVVKASLEDHGYVFRDLSPDQANFRRDPGRLATREEAERWLQRFFADPTVRGAPYTQDCDCRARQMAWILRNDPTLADDPPAVLQVSWDLYGNSSRPRFGWFRGHWAPAVFVREGDRIVTLVLDPLASGESAARYQDEMVQQERPAPRVLTLQHWLDYWLTRGPGERDRILVAGAHFDTGRQACVQFNRLREQR